MINNIKQNVKGFWIKNEYCGVFKNIGEIEKEEYLSWKMQKESYFKILIKDISDNTSLEF